MFGKSESLWVVQNQEYYILQSQGSWREDMASILNIYWWESVNYRSGTVDVNYVNWGEEDKVKPTRPSLAPTSAMRLTCRKWSDFTRDLPAARQQQVIHSELVDYAGLPRIQETSDPYPTWNALEGLFFWDIGFMEPPCLHSGTLLQALPFTNTKWVSRIWHIGN